MTEPGRPWWQLTNTPRQGFLLGGFWAVLGLVQWALLLFGNSGRLGWVLAVSATVLATGYLTTATMLRRRLAETAE